MKPYLVYDIEVIRGPKPANPDEIIPGIEYAAGWDDHVNMGIACICAVEVDGDGTETPHVFLADNMPEFFQVCEGKTLVGFNNIAFDDRVIAATRDLFIYVHAGTDSGWLEYPRYDLLREIWQAAGLGPKYQKDTHAGFGLDEMARVNLGQRKSGHGANAAVWWQQGQHGKVINYCMRDVMLTHALFKMARFGPLTNPKETGGLMLRLP